MERTKFDKITTIIFWIFLFLNVIVVIISIAKWYTYLNILLNIVMIIWISGKTYKRKFDESRITKENFTSNNLPFIIDIVNEAIIKHNDNVYSPNFSSIEFNNTVEGSDVKIYNTTYKILK